MFTKSATNPNGQKSRLKSMRKLYNKPLKVKNSESLSTLSKTLTDQLRNKSKILFQMPFMTKKSSVKISGVIFQQLLSK